MVPEGGGVGGALLAFILKRRYQWLKWGDFAKRCMYVCEFRFSLARLGCLGILGSPSQSGLPRTGSMFR